MDNYRPGVTGRLGIDYPSLKALNPRVVACSITGYGLTGPGRDRAALDATVQAFAGVMGMTGDPDGSPVRAGPLYGDLCAGMAGALGILAALAARGADRRRPARRHLHAGRADVAHQLPRGHAPHVRHPRRARQRDEVARPYNAYRATDGWVFVAVTVDPHWKAFVEKLNAPDTGLEGAALEAAASLQDEELATRAGRIANRDRINAALETIVATRSRDEWVSALAAAGGIPVAPVNTLDEAVQDAQVRSRRMIVEVEHPEGGSYEATGNPFKLSAAGEERFTPPPTLGQHTAEVLRDVLGYDAERVGALYADGSVA